MPSHPDRVRRSYHTITLREYEKLGEYATHIDIVITRRQIASAMSAYELKREIVRTIERGIDERLS